MVLLRNDKNYKETNSNSLLTVSRRERENKRKMTNCKDCIFSDVYDKCNDVYQCSLLTKIRQYPVLIDSNILEGFRKSFICPYFCCKENTINVFIKVHKRQFAKADLDSLYKKVYGGDEPNENK